MLTYEQRCDMITVHAWETWTKNGLGLDEDMRRETEKTVRDKVVNAYTDDVSDEEWLRRTLRDLGAQPTTKEN